MSNPACSQGKCTVLDWNSDKGRCALPGKCNVASALCEVHGKGKVDAEVGDPCLSDLDCAGNMICLIEEEDQGTVLNRNGYCSVQGCKYASTLIIKACPAGSECNRLYEAGLCQKICDLDDASTCRGGWQVKQTPPDSIPSIGANECI